MPAFLVVDTQIQDPETYERYKAQVTPIVMKHGGVYRARGGALEVFENDQWTPSRIVIIEFPSMDAARAFATDPDYAPIKALRRSASACTVAVVEGFEGA